MKFASKGHKLIVWGWIGQKLIYAIVCTILHQFYTHLDNSPLTVYQLKMLFTQIQTNFTNLLTTAEIYQNTAFIIKDFYTTEVIVDNP